MMVAGHWTALCPMPYADAGGVVVAERRYLSEVQGLRSVAALLVAVYHIWLQRVSGGVDVFFVVSAFFLISALMRREPMRLRDLGAQMVSTIRRIVPGTAIVIIVTIAGAIFFLPEPLWARTLEHARWSLLFAENWLLATSSVSYLAGRLVASPFQQMWALSVQMQMLLMLPVVYFALSLVARKLGRGRMVATVGFGLIFAVSLWFSVTETWADQVSAYYLTTTRAWEFAAGALLALWIDRVRLAPGLARLVGYAGLIVLVSFGLVIDVSRQFPGFVAVAPVLCALAIIAASANGGGMRLLNNRAMVGFADMSFAFYLWHWPLLVLARHTLQSSDAGFWGVAVIAGAGALAYASTRLVEAPVRRAPVLAAQPVLSVLVALLFVGVAGGAVWGWHQLYQGRGDAAHAALEAYRAAPETPLAVGQIVPDPIIARDDLPRLYADKCNQDRGAELVSCVYGDADGALTLAVVGGSHMAQWMDAFDAIGRANGYRIVTMTKNSCTFTSDRTISRSCTAWNEAVMTALTEMRPDLVVALATRTSGNPDMAPESIPLGYAAVFAELEAQRIRILGLRDNPRFAYDIPNCVSLRRSDLAACGRARDSKLGDIDRMLGDMGPNIHFVETTGLICDESFCPIVRNGILIYRDSHHLSRTFTMLLADQLAAATEAALSTPFTREQAQQ